MCMRQNSWLCSIRFAKDLLDLHSIKVSVCWKPQRVILVDPATCHCNGNQSLFIMRFIITYTVPHHHLYGTASSFIRHRIITYTVPHHHLYGTASSLIRHRIIIYTVPHHHLNHTAPHLPSHRTTPLTTIPHTTTLTTIPHTTQHPLHHIIKQTNHQ